MLLRLDARLAGSLFTEGQESADLVAKRGQGPIVGRGDSGHYPTLKGRHFRQDVEADCVVGRTRRPRFVLSCAGLHRTSTLALGLALSCTASHAAGAPSLIPEPGTGEPLSWTGPRFSTLDYVITVTGGAVTLAAAVFDPRSEHVLSGGIFFDDAVRGALRVEGIQTRYAFRDASDAGLSLAMTWPFFADSLVTAWWYRGSRDVAEQMSLIDLETFAIAGAVQGATNVLVSRERPYGSDCGTDELPAVAIDCDGSNRYRSFFSGHSAFAFTGAALICTHHFRTNLLGAPWDALSCAGGYTVAAATATFRVVSDVHYASDIITGALLGTLIGYGVPLLHYGGRVEAGEGADFRIQLVPSPGGIGVWGAF
jgi:membrane-associated phospholipid phosphatase